VKFAPEMVMGTPPLVGPLFDDNPATTGAIIGLV
jgi:hypothetical protein